jgi:antitoxin HigA-1
MIPHHRLPAHPGEVLLEEFLRPLGLPQLTFASALGVPIQRINEIIQGKRGISAETAWLFSQAFGTTPEFWINLQSAYDLARSRPRGRAGLRRSIWSLRCLMRARDAAQGREDVAVHLLPDLCVVESGELTGSFPLTQDGLAQLEQFIGETAGRHRG